MSVEELIQLMRTCSLAQVRKEMEIHKQDYPEAYAYIVAFFKRASKRK